MNSRKQQLLRIFLGIVTAAFIGMLYLPFLAMFTVSFTGPAGGPTLPLRGVSLYWYQQLFFGGAAGGISAGGEFSADVGAVRTSVAVPLLRSVALALLTTVISTLAGLLTALAFRRDFRGKTIVFYLVMLGAVVPGVALGLGVSLAAQEFDIGLGLVGTGLLSHLVWTYPFSLVILLVTFNRFDREIEEASSVLGASPWQTFRLVTLPNISTGLLTAALFSFTLSFDEVSRSFFSVGPDQTLPLVILASLTGRLTPRMYALGAITTIISLSLVAAYLTFVARRVRSRQGISESLEAT